MGTVTRAAAQARAMAAVKQAKRQRVVLLGTTTEKVARNRLMVAMRKEGATQRAIAEHFGVTKTVVARVLNRSGVQTKRDVMVWTDDMLDALQTARLSGVSIERAAHAVGVGYRQAWEKSAALGLGGRRA